jgi:Cu+-exporting ATPase
MVDFGLFGMEWIDVDCEKFFTKASTLPNYTIKKIKQNLFFAFVYNAAGIPIAAGLLYPFFGFLLSPIIAGAAMAFSSVSVVSNSLLMKRYKKFKRNKQI